MISTANHGIPVQVELKAMLAGIKPQGLIMESRTRQVRKMRRLYSPGLLCYQQSITQISAIRTQQGNMWTTAFIDIPTPTEQKGFVKGTR
jgi:hypothetical protein